MWISVVILAVLATVSAAPQDLLEYVVEGVGGPSYKVTNSNSGFSIESSNGGRSVGGSVSSLSSGSQSFGAQTGYGLSSGDVAALAGSGYRSAVAGQSSFSGAGSESLLGSVSGVGSHFAAQSAAVKQPVAQKSYVSSYESKSSSFNGGLVGVPQLSTVFNDAVSQSGVSTDSGSDSVVVGQQSLNSFGAQSDARFYTAPVSTSFRSQASNSQLYGNKNAQSVSGASYNAGVARPLTAVAHHQAGQVLRSGASNYGAQSNTGYLGTQSVAGQYGYGKQSHGSSLNYGSQLSGASLQKSASFNGQKSVSGSSNTGSVGSQSGVYRSSSAANYGLSSGLASGTYASGIQRGHSGVAQKTNAVYGVQPYGVVATKSSAVFNPVASGFGVQSAKSSVSQSGSNAYSGGASDVSGAAYKSSLVSSQAAQSVYPSQQSSLQYGAKLGNTVQSAAQRSSVSGLAARSDYGKYTGLSGAQSGAVFGVRSGEGNLGVAALEAQSVGSTYGARSGSLYGAQAYGGALGVQSAAARQASYNAAGGASSSTLGLGGSALQNSYILKQEQDQAEDGSHYTFSYDADNGISVQSSGGVKGIGSEQESQVMSGSYSYLGDDGQTYTVNYVADENGFQPQGAHIHPIPEEIQRSLEYNLAHPEEVTIL